MMAATLPPNLISAAARATPERLKGLIKENLYRSIPYGLSQALDRLLRSDTFQLLESFRPHCQRHGCIFVHVPRTAGTSISQALFDGPKPGGHEPAWHFRMIFDAEAFDRLFKFSIVRNPWDRLVSTYFFLKDGGMREEDRRWAADNLTDFDTFDEFVRHWLRPERLWAYTHFRPQSYYLFHPDGQLEVDLVGRFERLQRSFEQISSELGISADLPHRNRAPRQRDYRQYYSDEAAEIVADVYQRDIELLGYTF